MWIPGSCTIAIPHKTSPALRPAPRGRATPLAPRAVQPEPGASACAQGSVAAEGCTLVLGEAGAGLGGGPAGRWARVGERGRRCERVRCGCCLASLCGCLEWLVPVSWMCS